MPKEFKEKTKTDDATLSSLLSEPDTNILDTLDENLKPEENQDVLVEKSSNDVVIEKNVKIEALDKKFINQLSSSEIESLKKEAPALVERMVNDHNYIVEFGTDVMERSNNIQDKILDHNKKIKLFEANKITNDILKTIDGYNAKYGNAKLQKKLNSFAEKIRGSGYTLRAMIRDAQPLEKKLNIAENNILKMEQKLDENSENAEVLREATLEMIRKIVKVIAVFEELIAETVERNEAMDNLLQEALQQGDNLVIYNGNRYTVEEFREFFSESIDAQNEMEKSWHAWRQRFFFYFANLQQLKVSKNYSLKVKRDFFNLRNAGIPAAKNAIINWQNAEVMKKSAISSKETKKGINKLITQSYDASATAVREVADTTEQDLLTENTVNAMVNSIKDQFNTIVESEAKGRAERERMLQIVQNSEKEIANASIEARERLVNDALRRVNNENHSRLLSNTSSKDSLKQLGLD